MIPGFRNNGSLPPGIHKAAWEEVVSRFGSGPRRRELLDGLLAACRDLRKGGVQRVWLDGSFVTKKRDPNDYDGCFSMTELQNDHAIDPVWFDSVQPRSAMKAKFKGELMIAEMLGGGPGQPYFDFFQKDRDGKSKGIVELDLGTLP
jgi:hypothetical protein